MSNFLGNKLPKIIGACLNALSYIAPKWVAKKALSLFATPRKGRILEIQKPFLETAEQKILLYNELPIMTYKWQGTKDTILLVHGWESNSFRWQKLILQLKTENHTLIALDAPSHGASGGDSFNAILYAEFINVTAKCYNPNIIIGHSVGGMASIFFNKIFQYTPLEKLVLLGTPSEFSTIFKNYTTLLGYNSGIKKELDKLITKRFGNTPESFSAARYIANSRARGLIIHDEEDEIINHDEALLLAEYFINAELISTNGFGHSLYHEKINEHIMEFINS